MRPAAARPTDNALGDEPRLLLYALSQQATVGPNNTPQPWGWNVVDKAKWQSWQQLVSWSKLGAPACVRPGDMRPACGGGWGCAGDSGGKMWGLTKQRRHRSLIWGV